jgi:hypothetical protein
MNTKAFTTTEGYPLHRRDLIFELDLAILWRSDNRYSRETFKCAVFVVTGM